MPWYFAYGSNMHSGTLRQRRGVEYTRALPARAPGWRLLFDKPGLLPTGEAFANIAADPGAEVLGVLFEVSDADLAHIELTEGVLIGNYARVTTPVAAVTVPLPVATAFTLSSPRRAPGVQPSIRYMRLLIAGAIEHGLPPAHVEFLRRVPTRAESEEAARLQPMVDAFLRQRG